MCACVRAEQGGERQTWAAEGVLGEPVFVPRLGVTSAKHGEEDDGWVLQQVCACALSQVICRCCGVAGRAELACA